ncbi:MAG: SurA N-terminal domain-containing protein, partial [Woeseiaceae bacterium]|nr:SurA N-terminal domain-containing protein [Woeseiaceae bacterium]
MLQTIRERFTGTFAITILAIICVPFVFFGVTNFDFTGASNAASVDGVDIPVVQLERAYQDQLQQYAQYGELPADFRRQLKANVLDNLIRNTVVELYLSKQGYRVTDQMVADVIQRESAFFVDGKFSKDRYYSVLDENAIDPTRFEESQRENLRQSQLQRGIAATS